MISGNPSNSVTQITSAAIITKIFEKIILLYQKIKRSRTDFEPTTFSIAVTRKSIGG